MSTKTITELDREAESKTLELKGLLERPDDQLTTEDAARIPVLDGEIKSIGDELEKFADSRKDAAKSLNRLENSRAALKTIDRPSFGNPKRLGSDGPATNRNGDVNDAIKSLGDSFITDDRFAQWLDRIAPEREDGTRKVPNQLQAMSPTIALKSLITLAGDVTSGRPMLGLQERRPEIVTLGWPELMLRALVSVIPTNSDSIQTVRELSRTNAAASVAEATDVTGASGLKPQSTLAWEVVTVDVKTIAHWIATSSRVLSDAARLRGEIDAFLRTGLAQELERQMLVGNPGGSNAEEFVGILNTSGILTQAYATDLLTTTRKARTNLRLNGRVIPTAFVFNPADWETIDLTQDQEARYYFGGPTTLGVPRLWGVPVVESEFETAGTGLLAYFPDAVLYDRQETNISMGTVNDDYIRNIIRIMAEMRAAFHVRRPKSFVSIDLTA